MKQKLFLFGLITLIFGFSINIFAQERYLRPVDEGKSNASFSLFRKNLIKAVKKRDKKYLIGILDPNIKVSFGGDDGIEDFQNYWNLDTPDRSKLWDELLAALSNGGTFSKEETIKTKQFCAPYTFTSFPEDLDAFEHNVIFGNNVRLRAKPDLSAEIITQLSYNIIKIDFENSVKTAENGEDYSWYKITTLGGKTGFVSADYVRSPIAYRACFEKKNKKWKMTAFVAGD